MNKDRLQTLARDLRKTPPRSPRETLGGFTCASTSPLTIAIPKDGGVIMPLE